jgi:hypothetical protein
MTVNYFMFRGDDHLEAALNLALQGITGPMKVNCYRTDDKTGEIVFGFHYGNPGEYQPLPVAMTGSEIWQMVMSWLADATYPPAPDTDGTVRRGFAVDNTIAHRGWDPGLVTVTPHWTVYGK